MVFYPNSLDRAETIIITAKKVLDDAILHNALSMNELPPFTMSTLRDKRTAENKEYWSNMMQSQLVAVYSSLQHTVGILTRESLSGVSRDGPIEWAPSESIVRYERQTIESYEEQKVAIALCEKQINKYRNSGRGGQSTCLKNTVVYGTPGAGKSFVGGLVVLYALSQGLNVVSTALMALRAIALGGTHLHAFFKLPTSDGAAMSPYKAAEIALEKIRRKTDLFHALLTIDIIFLDEASQVSSDFLATIDIILRRGRCSQIPFAGVMIIGTMDHRQLQPINLLPFLTLSLMLTCFVMVELKHSVRAHGHPRFKRLQDITRMDPYELRESQELRDEIF